MRSPTLMTAIVTTALSVAACSTTGNPNAIQENDAAIYQQVSTSEKAGEFYKDKTVVLKVASFSGVNGKTAPPGQVPSKFTVQPSGLSIEYYAPDGTAYLAFDGFTNVFVGNWSTQKSRNGYVRVCSKFPALKPGTKCKTPKKLFEDNEWSKIYSGDIMGISRGQFPAGTRQVDWKASFPSILKSLGAGSPAPITAKQSR